MKYIVKTPSQTFNGKRAGIDFVKGQASFDDANLVPMFKASGYEVEEVEVKQPAAKPKAARKKRGE